ncbi:hypothetical protein PCASD_17218 [Puccinia coronata f. sp. avenae]|uniref:Uncharacterized protein n=1 Tax=Puccinia coronata f. sp. avenae TaxID=200324 RepID=A0A2N5T2V2_9BASI|nr:hypothetical protein PCASD_17218 [Puccinia coronata f. sp. avenae]
MQKRMLVSRVNDIKTAVEDGGSAIHGAGSLGATSDLGKMDSASLRLERVGQDSDVHFQPPPDKSFWQKPVKKLSSGIDSIKALRKSIWESVKFKLSGFFRKIRGWWQTITGTSDPVGKADLLDHKLMDEKLDHKSMDEKLDQLIKQLEHDHPKIKNELPEFYATVKPILQSSLANSKRMREEFDYASRGIAYKQKEISQNIEPILLDWEGKKPIEVLGNRIASSLSLDVAKDQEVLQDNLPEHLKYLSNLPGLMGPQNIFEALVKLGFKEHFKTEESLKYVTHVEGLVENYWSNLEVLRHRLGDFSKLYRRKVFSGVNSDPTFEVEKAMILNSIIHDETIEEPKLTNWIPASIAENMGSFCSEWIYSRQEYNF